MPPINNKSNSANGFLHSVLHPASSTKSRIIAKKLSPSGRGYSFCRPYVQTAIKGFPRDERLDAADYATQLVHGRIQDIDGVLRILRDIDVSERKALTKVSVKSARLLQDSPRALKALSEIQATATHSANEERESVTAAIMMAFHFRVWDTGVIGAFARVPFEEREQVAMLTRQSLNIGESAVREVKAIHALPANEREAVIGSFLPLKPYVEKHHSAILIGTLGRVPREARAPLQQATLVITKGYSAAFHHNRYMEKKGYSFDNREVSSNIATSAATALLKVDSAQQASVAKTTAALFEQIQNAQGAQMQHQNVMSIIGAVASLNERERQAMPVQEFRSAADVLEFCAWFSAEPEDEIDVHRLGADGKTRAAVEAMLAAFPVPNGDAVDKLINKLLEAVKAMPVKDGDDRGRQIQALYALSARRAPGDEWRGWLDPLNTYIVRDNPCTILSTKVLLATLVGAIESLPEQEQTGVMQLLIAGIAQSVLRGEGDQLFHICAPGQMQNAMTFIQAEFPDLIKIIPVKNDPQHYASQLFTFIEEMAVDHVVPAELHEEAKRQANKLVDEASSIDRQLRSLNLLTDEAMTARAAELKEFFNTTMNDTYNLDW